MYGYIYLTVNSKNNKKYLGQHKGEFDPSYHGSGIALKNAIKKYGEDSFITIMLCQADSREELDRLEKEYISKFDALVDESFYNIHEGGTGGNTKSGYSYERYKEMISKMSDSGKNRESKGTFDNCSRENRPHTSELSKIKRRCTYNRNHDGNNTDDVFRDVVLSCSDEEVLKKAFSTQNGACNPSATSYKLTNTETGEEIVLGAKSLLANYLGVSVRQADSIISGKYYKPYNIEVLGKTKDVSYISTYSIRRLDNIIRYNNRIKNHCQTVASHSYYVSYTMMRLLDFVDIPIDMKYKLLSYCLVHDISEVHIGDTPHDVKAANPELKDMLERFEDDFYAQAGLHGISDIIRDDYQKIKYNLFKLCDLLDVFMYAKEEMYLGNQSIEMANIMAQSVEDCNTIVKALKFYKVLPKDFNYIKFLDDIYVVKVITTLDDKCYKYTTEEMNED